MFIRRFRESNAEKVSKMIIRTERITNSKNYSEEAMNALEKRAKPSHHIYQSVPVGHIFTLLKRMIQLSVAVQSVLIGVAKQRAACLIYLFYLNIKAKVQVEKLQKHLNRTSISLEQNALRQQRQSRQLTSIASQDMIIKMELTISMRNKFIVWKSSGDCLVTPKPAK